MTKQKPSTVQFKPRPHHRHGKESTVLSNAAIPTPSKREKSPIGWDDGPANDSFSSYMHHKNRKLRQQFTSEFASSPLSQPSSKVFAGVVVWVNGHTNPSRLQIRRIMGQHGGSLETYCTSRVTHIVATNLATATRLRFTSNSSTTPRLKFVTPEWISDSLSQARRLSENDYPIPMMANPNQRSISSFFSPKTAKIANTKQSIRKLPESKQ